MHRAHIGKPAAWRNDGKGCAGLAPKEEQTGVLQRRVHPLFGFGMKVVKNGAPGIGIVHHPVERVDNDTGIHMAVVRQELADLPQRQGLVIGLAIPGQHPVAEPSKGGVMDQLAEVIFRLKMRIPGWGAARLSRVHGGLVGRRGTRFIGCAAGQGQEHGQHPARQLASVGQPMGFVHGVTGLPGSACLG